MKKWEDLDQWKIWEDQLKFFIIITMFKIGKSCKKLIFGPVKHEKFSRCLLIGAATERWRYNVTSPLIGWTHTKNDPWCFMSRLRSVVVDHAAPTSSCCFVYSLHGGRLCCPSLAMLFCLPFEWWPMVVDHPYPTSPCLFTDCMLVVHLAPTTPCVLFTVCMLLVVHLAPASPCCFVYSLRDAGLILGLGPANERRRYFVTPSLIGWVQI